MSVYLSFAFNKISGVRNFQLNVNPEKEGMVMRRYFSFLFIKFLPSDIFQSTLKKKE